MYNNRNTNKTAVVVLDTAVVVPPQATDSQCTASWATPEYKANISVWYANGCP